MLPLWEAVCLAVVVAPTEVALIDAVLEDRRVPERVRMRCRRRAGSTTVSRWRRSSPHSRSRPSNVICEPARWAGSRFALSSFPWGSASPSVRRGGDHRPIVCRGWMSDTWAQLATLALALSCFGAGEHLHASGFVTAFAGGLGLRVVSSRGRPAGDDTQVSDAVGELLELLVFAMFGGFAVIPVWRDAGWQVVVFAVLAVFAVRVVAVLLSMVRTGLPLPSTLFMGWFGPRGIGTLVLGLLVIDNGDIAHNGLITQVVVVTVTLSLVLHSLTAPIAVRLAARPA